MVSPLRPGRGLLRAYSLTAVSGWNAAHANQRCVPCTIGVSRVPANGPLSAWPKMFQTDPLRRSRNISGSSGSGLNCSRSPSTSGSKTANAPTSRLSSIRR